MLGLKLNHVSKSGHRRHQWVSGLYQHPLVPSFKSLRLKQNGHHFANNTFNCLSENVWIPIKIWLKFVPKGPINNIPALVQIMAWRRPGDKSLSEPMMVGLLTHICITRPQWVNTGWVIPNRESPLNAVLYLMENETLWIFQGNLFVYSLPFYVILWCCSRGCWN